MTTEDTGTSSHLEPNAFARELLAHDPTLPEVPELPGEAKDKEAREARDAAQGDEHGDEGERFDAG
ncbi:hypothetical protein [Isoptericola variabilis]|uniref:Uncharacterized protein n=1 Tax=Isoptericola variabilis (strain 225) TaxID=743718 RepID=F6FSA1_ISOV2|nr:hypothetical protein [Isoptericola variabilis]AEG43042.1 hypothetical protein Isova_0237 [Isoptericola variabilis 225]TWH29990.1 hypothetical protein L600_003400000200 [Isoptericola variabilis J7]